MNMTPNNKRGNAILQSLPHGYGKQALQAAGITAEHMRAGITGEQLARLETEGMLIRDEHGTRADQTLRQREAERRAGIKGGDGDLDDLENGLQNPGAGGGVPSGREFD